MSTSQNSSSSGPSKGVCPVCRKVGRLHGAQGLLYRHGPHEHPYPGSGQPPSAHNEVVGASHGTSSVNNIGTSASILLDISTSHEEFTGAPPLVHPTLQSAVLKHVPKAARSSCNAKLSSILSDVCNQPEDLNKWNKLLNFGGDILRKPARGGRRHNIGKVVSNRCEHSSPAPASSQGGPKPKKDPTTSLASAVASKIEDGNLRAAIRMLSSNEQLASFSEDTRAKLQEKYPPAHVDRRPFPDPLSFESLFVSVDKVKEAVRSFPAGSSGGPDGFRPQHMVELVNRRESNNTLISVLTDFVNLLLSGRCPPAARTLIFGGKLLALNKKDGGLRPIAVGYYWRRLAAKCANSHAIEKLGSYFGHIQLGVGVAGGCEAAIHAARRFITFMDRDQVLVKLDFKNAFNSVHRDIMLDCVASKDPRVIQILPPCLRYTHFTSIW